MSKIYLDTCILCGKSYKAHWWLCRNGLCPDCYTPERDRQRTILRNQLNRAKRAGNLVTLNYCDWINCLDYFDWLCAYCRVYPYTILEHYVSISQGGGTTVLNCVPACQKCNSGRKHRDGADRIVLEYFRTIKTDQLTLISEKDEVDATPNGIVRCDAKGGKYIRAIDDCNGVLDCRKRIRYSLRQYFQHKLQVGDMVRFTVTGIRPFEVRTVKVLNSIIKPRNK